MKLMWLNEQGKLETYKMTSVPFGTTCSPFLLAVVLQYHLEQNENKYPVVKLMKNQIYVDDLVTTVNSKDELRRLKEEAELLMADCSMMLLKWRTSENETDQKWTKG